MNLSDLLQQADLVPHKVVKYDSCVNLNLSKDNQDLAKVDLNDEKAFTDYIFGQLKDGEVGVGGYAEVRSLYSRSDLFEGEEPRTVHLGIDVWSAAGTPIYVPLASKVHSYANRNIHGDYGPVIILEHVVDETVFHSLYGHMSKTSLDDIYVGKTFEPGELLGTMGSYAENYHWPPHLHFQLIVDMQGFEGDYPGVVKASELPYYLLNCPSPEIFV